MTARDLALEALLALERGDVSAREALEVARPRVADAREASFLTEVVYATLRRQGTLDVLLSGASARPLSRLDAVVRAALRLALAQALFLDRVPAHAAVDHAVGAVRERTNARLAGYANAVLRNVLRSVEGRAEGDEDPRRDVPRPGAAAVRLRRPAFPDPAADLAGNLAARYGHPRFLVERWLSRSSPAATRAALEAGVTRPAGALLAAPGGREALLAELAAAGAPGRPGDDPDVVFVDAADVSSLAPVREGRARAVDVAERRVERLLGGPAALVLPAPPRAVAPLPPGSLPRVLVRAPSTGTGVLARRPERTARLRLADVAASAARQRELVGLALPLVAPGGRLVYAVGSVEPEETEEVVAFALAAGPGWRRGDGFLAPPSPDAPGGFGAALRRDA